MSQITRYILRQILIGTVFVSLALAFIVWLTQSLRFLQLIMSRGLSLASWLELTLLMMPTFMALILPIALFLVVLFVYHKLGQDRELVVVQAAGVSRSGLARPAIIAGLVCMGIGYMLSLWGVPAATRAFKQLQWSIRNDVTQVLLREGSFNQLGKNLTVYVRDRDRNGDLLGLLVYDRREGGAAVTMMAERGRVADGGNPDDGTRIILGNGNRQQIGADGALSVLYFDSYAVDLGNIGATESRWLANGERSTADLLAMQPGDGYDAKDIRRMRAEAHHRLAGPLATLGYTLVALTWLLTGAFDKGGATARVIAAACTVVALEAAMLGAMALVSGATGWSPLMYLLGLLPIAIGLYALLAGRTKPAPVRPMATRTV